MGWYWSDSVWVGSVFERKSGMHGPKRAISRPGKSEWTSNTKILIHKDR